MAEALGAAGSIVGIVAFGLQLAAKLQAHVEAVVEASDRLTEIRFDVNSTAATLYQLKDLLDKDQDASVRVFPDAGVREIASLATRCSQIYSTITKRLDKAAESSGNGERKVGISTDGTDQTPLKITKLGLRRSLAWPWLEPEIERYQKRLGRVKLDLLLQLQLANLGRFQIENPTLNPESEEERQILCQLTNSFRRSPVRNAEKPTGQGTATLPPVFPPARAKSDLQLERHRECATSDTAENGRLHAGAGMGEAPGGEADGNYSHASSQDSIGAMDLGQDRRVSLHLSPSWIQKIFQPDLRAPCLDWESAEFEAFLLDVTVEFGGKAKATLNKLEVGHLELQDALAGILPLQRRKIRLGVWKKCKSLEPRVRHEVHGAITAVKQWSRQKKVWIAMEIMESQTPHAKGGSRPLTNGRETSIILFFRLGEMVEPVRMEYTDRRVLLPYEHCRTWEMTKTILTQAFHKDVSFDKLVRGGEYYIQDVISGSIIAPPVWRSLVRPGMYLRIRPRLCPSTPRKGAHNPGATFTPVPEGNRWPSSSIPTRTIACTMVKREVSPTRQTIHAAPGRRVASCADTGSRLHIDQEIERLLDEEERYANEVDRAKLCVRELLAMWTNAPNAGIEDDFSDKLSLPRSGSKFSAGKRRIYRCS